MIVEELISTLQDMPPEAEIRIMEQPSWPFENDIAGVWESSKAQKCPHGDQCNDECECHDYEQSEFTPHGNPESGVVYIVEGSQLAYGTEQAWNDERMI